jgi:hypothetical protein
MLLVSTALQVQQLLCQALAPRSYQNRRPLPDPILDPGLLSPTLCGSDYLTPTKLPPTKRVQQRHVPLNSETFSKYEIFYEILLRYC